MMWWWVSAAFAGLGPMDTVVVFNADSPEATAIADHYAASRDLPLAHRCGVTGIDASTTSIDFATFVAEVRDPLEACLARLPHPDEIDVLVTVRGLPYLVDTDAGRVGFEAALQVLHATDSRGDEVAGQDPGSQARVPNPVYAGTGPCPTQDLTVENPYGGNYGASCELTRAPRLPRAFARTQGLVTNDWTFTDNLFAVGRLDGFDFDDARDLVDRSVASDDAPPDGELLCMHGGDSARGARDPECEYVVRRLAEIGANATWVPSFDGALSGRRLAGFLTGATNIQAAIPDHDWLPGAIAGNLTSFGAVPNNFFCDKTGKTCPERESQTSIARFVRAGATGAHGTVAEPLNNSFPDASTLLLYHEGYTMGEAFLFSSKFLYWYNLVLGDPLAAPYAQRPAVEIQQAPTNTLPLVLAASHPDGIAAIELFVDGVRVATVDDATELTWTPALEGTDTFEMHAIATAGVAVLGRPPYDDTVSPPVGWELPQETQRARPATQGWLHDTVVVTEDAPESGGCTTGRAPLSGAAVLVALLAFHRRRRLR